jgi:O6-methylguanine-DNA--protein-cysteine methyltransferase
MLDAKSDLWKSFFLAHQVVGSGGDLTGYTGGLKVKQALLELEQFHDK